jgi:hypothetical protein
VPQIRKSPSDRCLSNFDLQILSRTSCTPQVVILDEDAELQSVIITLNRCHEYSWSAFFLGDSTKGELISQKSGRCSTFRSQPHRQPLILDAKYPLTRENSPPILRAVRSNTLSTNQNTFAKGYIHVSPRHSNMYVALCCYSALDVQHKCPGSRH